MFNKDSFTDDLYASRGFQTADGQFRGNRNSYDMNKFDDEMKASTPCLKRTSYNLNSKNDFKIGTCNHFQELNEKFQELETKMFEVEKCFKEANKLDMDEAKLPAITETKYPVGNSKNVHQSRLYEVSESRKETTTYPSNVIKDWFSDHRSTIERKQQQNPIIRDGSGDTPQVQNGVWSDDSCKTLTKTLEKPPAHLSNRQGVKSIFTVNHFDEVHQRFSNNPSTDVDFLEKSKKLILTLIDKELKKMETEPNQFIPMSQPTAASTTDAKRNLKMECILNIEKELNTLKKLESLE